MVILDDCTAMVVTVPIAIPTSPLPRATAEFSDRSSCSANSRLMFTVMNARLKKISDSPITSRTAPSTRSLSMGASSSP